MSLSDAPDRIIAGRAADGDVRAFEVLVRRHGPLLRVYALRMLGSNADVDDVVQDTFVTAWSQLPNLENRAAVKSWLVRIAGRKCIDIIRARRHHADIDDYDPVADPAGSPAAQSEAQSLGEALSIALTALPDGQRRVWVLREISGYSYDDIADHLGIPVSTVRGMLARARKTLLRDLEAWR